MSCDPAKGGKKGETAVKNNNNNNNKNKINSWGRMCSHIARHTQRPQESETGAATRAS